MPDQPIHITGVNDINDQGAIIGANHENRVRFVETFKHCFIKNPETGGLIYQPIHYRLHPETGERQVLVQRYVDTKTAQKILGAGKRDVFYDDLILKSLRIKLYPANAKSKKENVYPSRYPEALVRFYAGDLSYQFEWKPCSTTYTEKDVANMLQTRIATMKGLEGFPKPINSISKRYYWSDIEDFMFDNYELDSYQLLDPVLKLAKLMQYRAFYDIDNLTRQTHCAVQYAEKKWERILGKAQIESALHAAIVNWVEMSRKKEPQNRKMWKKMVVAFSDAIAQNHTITNYESAESKFPISAINKMIDELQAADISTLKGDDIADKFTKKTREILNRIDQKMKKNMIELAGGTPEAKNHYLLNGATPSHWFKEMDRRPSGKISNKPLKRPPPGKPKRLFGFFGRIKGD